MKDRVSPVEAGLTTEDTEEEQKNCLFRSRTCPARLQWPHKSGL